jgi:Na+-transporting NADH:ubiquinone oxidoreductase subunit NqrD
VVGKIVLIIGILGVVLGGGVLLVSVLLPVVTDGRTSWEEALLGIIPGAVVLVISFLIAVVGVILVLRKRRAA